MSSYLVSYDLVDSKQDNVDLIIRIKSYIACYHCLRSTWIIRTESTATEVKKHLQGALQTQDRLLVVKLDEQSLTA